MPKLTARRPLNPYRGALGPAARGRYRKHIITHDAGSPRDQLSPFWKPVEPLVLYRLGQATQLGYGWGSRWRQARKTRQTLHQRLGGCCDRFTGMDFETAVRERIPIMSILLNNCSMHSN